MKLAALIFSVLVFARPACAQDVYNFYFQKAQSATEMVQVKNGEAIGAKPATSPNASSSTLAASTSTGTAETKSAQTAPSSDITTTVASSKARDFSRDVWRVSLGLATLNDRRAFSAGYGLKVGYGFNRYFGVEGQFVGGKVLYSNFGAQSNLGSANLGRRAMVDEQTRGSNYYGGAVGVRITPIHMNVFGWDLVEASVLAGAISSAAYDTGSVTPGSPLRTRLDVRPYAGASLALNLADRLSAELDAKFEIGNDEVPGLTPGQTMFALAYKF